MAGRIMYVEGNAMRFDVEIFKRIFVKKAKEAQMGIGEYEQFVADRIKCSRDSIHNWRNDRNGPGCIEIVEDLAELWDCDYMKLLKNVEEEKKNGEKTMRNETSIEREEKEAVKRVYVAMLDYITQFERSNGFTSDVAGNKPDVVLEMEWRAQYENMLYALRKEMFDIPQELFERVDEFIGRMENLELLPPQGYSSTDWDIEVLGIVRSFFTKVRELFCDYIC